ncbi:uncharacterized protein G2W53_039204 [Senna tora]|uniref:Uncharacterized protein n=1 Tax=Senna tora TaxID=362788 RepID=A0A834SQA6_9FABA|nr:uncharacterized protein G2W53_039204 [Senna tora]
MATKVMERERRRQHGMGDGDLMLSSWHTTTSYERRQWSSETHQTPPQHVLKSEIPKGKL